MPAPLLSGINAQSLMMFGNGSFQFAFTNTNSITFNVLASTNVSLPISRWTELGDATILGGGLYQLGDPEATNSASRFYLLRFPRSERTKHSECEVA